MDTYIYQTNGIVQGDNELIDPSTLLPIYIEPGTLVFGACFSQYNMTTPDVVFSLGLEGNSQLYVNPSDNITSSSITDKVVAKFNAGITSTLPVRQKLILNSSAACDGILFVYLIRIVLWEVLTEGLSIEASQQLQAQRQLVQQAPKKIKELEEKVGHLQGALEELQKKSGKKK